MYLGKIVEIGDVDSVFDNPRHPYTRALLSAIPVPDPRRERTRERIILKGELPSPLDAPVGCNFASRCPVFAALPPAEQAKCLTVEPPLETDDAHPDAEDQRFACFYPDGALDAELLVVRETH
jgi:peptide/nickel transport system ATP-binding protein